MNELISAQDLNAIAIHAVALSLVAKKLSIDTTPFLDLAKENISQNGGMINIGDKTIAIFKNPKYKRLDLKVSRKGPNNVR